MNGVKNFHAVDYTKTVSYMVFKSSSDSATAAFGLFPFLVSSIVSTLTAVFFVLSQTTDL